MVQTNDADDNMGYKLKEVRQQLPKINDTAAQMDFLISMFFSNEDFNVVELFNAGNLERVKKARNSSLKCDKATINPRRTNIQ